MEILVVLSEWCPACLEYKVILNQIVTELNVNIIFKYPQNVPFPIKAIPTTIFFNKDKVLGFYEGSLSKYKFLNLINSLKKKM